MDSEAGALCVAVGERGGAFEQAVNKVIAPALQSHLGPRADGSASIRWLPIETLGAAKHADEALIRQLATAPVVVIDADLRRPEIYYLVGAREALTNGVTLVAHTGRPEWSLQLCNPTFVDLASAEGATTVANALRGLVDRRYQQYCSAFQSSRAVNVAASDPIAQLSEGESESYIAKRNGTPLQTKLGIKCGDIRSITDVKAWVNSENDGMQMARVTDKSISATIRALGARDIGLTGDFTDDATAVALARVMGARQRVQIGDVLVTEAPEDSPLRKRNKVLAVAHVAAVEPAGPGQGFLTGHHIDRCVENTLVELERFVRDKRIKKLETVLFPLLGAGDGGAPPAVIASQMVGHLIESLGRSTYGFDRVYFLAYRQSHKAAILGAFDAYGCEPVAASTGRANAP